MKRRKFLKTSVVAGAAWMVPTRWSKLAAQPAMAGSAGADGSMSTLPWMREIPLREAAKSVALEGVLNPTNPSPASGESPSVDAAMAINNLKMRTTLWGPPNRITISLTKNNVWDRRLPDFKPPTLKDITDGAYAKVNENYVGVGEGTLRPKDLGWLWKEGGSHDPYRQPIRYAFPSMKPVGQIILGIDALTGAKAPHLHQSCASGVVIVQAAKDDARANVEYVLGMTSNIYGIRASINGINSPVWLRLYRHRDTSHLYYMTPDGKSYTNPAAEAGKAFNGAIDPPTSGTNGKYFWIRQRMPAEKTFPGGFEYVLMGKTISPQQLKMDALENTVGLGTPPAAIKAPWDLGGPTPQIADAPGAAATATLEGSGEAKLEALVTVVTTMDGEDLIAIAKKRLTEAERRGFDGLVEENVSWWSDFYDHRENGRVFHGTTGSACTDNVREIYRSYADNHGGGTKTDMRKLECSAGYALPERDFQQWFSAPCYNEIFTTSRFVRNWGDSEEMWKQIAWHWMPGGQESARTMFNMPGMLISHGYLPPIKPDQYAYTSVTLLFCLGTMAQILRPSWDEWDYGGEIKVLREECYPLLKQMALFYAAYAKKGSDGYYHVIPSMQEEDWGFYPKFARNKDVISSLCMFKWGLVRAADAAELLGVDAELRDQWREVAAQIVPYATWQTPEGPVLAEMPGVEPYRLPGDHFGDAASYPALLADEINLDSPHQLREMVVRGVRRMFSGSTNPTLTVLGVELPQPSPAGVGEPTGAAARRWFGSRFDPEMLLNSRSGRIHLFPVNSWDPPAIDAVTHRNEIGFRKFQARGGFLVSACKDSDGVYYVEIEARRDATCQLMNPWSDCHPVVHRAGSSEIVPVQVDHTNGECLVFSAHAGERYVVSRG